MTRALSLLFALLCACREDASDPALAKQGPAQKDWWQWHAEKRDVDIAVDEAVDSDGDYAKAVEVLRRSDRPADVKQFQIGMLIIGSFDDPRTAPSPDTLETGLRMVEDAATMRGEIGENGPQHLRLIFERGAGSPPDIIPIDLVVAKCWRAIEDKKADDPARCIALRRERLPRVGR